MRISTTLRTVGIFLAVAGATFVATDPAALPDWAKALIGASIAGLAAVGITPPASAPMTVIDNFNRLRNQTQTVTTNLGARVAAVEDDHAELSNAHDGVTDAMELALNALRDRIARLEGTPPPPPPSPLTLAPEVHADMRPPDAPEPTAPPAPEVPS